MKQHDVPMRITLLLFFVLLIPVFSCEAESVEGFARVYGYKETVRPESRKFAPYAVLTDERENEHDYKLRYYYTRYDTYTRVWDMELCGADGHRCDYVGRIDVYLPYPVKWNTPSGGYWKWTKSYAERYNWNYSKGFSMRFVESNTVIAGLFVGTPARSITPSNAFGFRVTFFHGLPGSDDLPSKSVMIKIVDNDQTGDETSIASWTKETRAVVRAEARTASQADSLETRLDYDALEDPIGWMKKDARRFLRAVSTLESNSYCIESFDTRTESEKINKPLLELLGIERGDDDS